MAVRVPLPNRIQLQTLEGLRSAIVGGANAVSNNVITTTDVLGHINAFEDDFLSPLRLIWMRTTDNQIILDQYGRFDIRTSLSQPLLEIVSVWSSAAPAGSVSGAYYQYEVPYDRKDLNTFRKLQGNVNVEPIYTVDGSIVKVWPPANYYGPLNCTYYADYPKMGDLVTSSTLQTQVLNISGTASVAGTLTFTTNTTQIVVVPILLGDTAAVLANRIALAAIPYSVDAGGNKLNWTKTYVANATTVSLIAPSYVSANVTFTVVQAAGTGISVVNTNTQSASLQYVQTNWFMQNYPYLYYYGALKHVFLYLNDLERAKYCSDQAMKFVQELQAISDRADVSDPSDGFNFNQNVQW